MRLTWPPRAEDPAATYIAQLRARIEVLQAEVLAANRRELAARRQAEALELRLVVGNTALEELARMRRTLLDYEDQLATCRDQHGGNTRSGPHPFDRCIFCRLPVAGPLAECENPDCEKKFAQLHAGLVAAAAYNSAEEA